MAFFLITTTIVRRCPSHRPPHVNNSDLGGQIQGTFPFVASQAPPAGPCRQQQQGQVTTFATPTTSNISTAECKRKRKFIPQPNHKWETGRGNHDTTEPRHERQRCDDELHRSSAAHYWCGDDEDSVSGWGHAACTST